MDKIATLVLRLPRSIKRLIEDLSDDQGITPSKFIEELVLHYTKGGK